LVKFFLGQGGFTYTQRVAVEYKPTTNQQVCNIKHGVFKQNNPTDDLILTVKLGGIDPLGGCPFENCCFLFYKV